METTFSAILTFFNFYFGIGLLFAINFVIAGINKVDEGAKGAPVFFKMLLLPGLMMLWPIFLVKWMGAKS